jgi:hypothetical protein
MYIIAKKTSRSSKDYSIVGLKFSAHDAETSIEKIKAKENRFVYEIINTDDLNDEPEEHNENS